MTKSPDVHAIAKLGQIADLGYSVLADATDGSLVVLSSNHSANWMSSDFQKWMDDGDTLMSWLRSNLGSKLVSTIETGALAEACLKFGATTIVADLYAGSRLGLILSHSKNELDEAEIKEARAAGLTIQMHHQDDTKSGITAKELIYLEQVSAGATDDEIAAELQLSLRAVKERKRKAIDDLHANNIGHAVGIAKRTKLI